LDKLLIWKKRVEADSLITDLKIIELNKDTRLCSFDITNMYTNIPKIEVINIIKKILENNNEIEKNIKKQYIY
jgi:hypothetical protein